MTRSDAAEMNFMSLGVQYYTAARSAVLAQLVPVCGNLYHHSVEMLLKARLSQTHSLEELSHDPFGHRLCPLWNAFREEFPTANLNQFDDTIATLDRFERIRYPDATIDEGAQFFIQWDPGPWSSGYASGITPPPRFQIVVTDIDRLFARIFEVCSKNPVFFTGRMNEYARDAIRRDNPAGCALFPSRQ